MESKATFVRHRQMIGLVIAPKQASLLLQVSIKKHKAIRIFGLIHHKYQFRSSVIVVIAGINERHK